jgi:hypothetical protein
MKFTATINPLLLAGKFDSKEECEKALLELVIETVWPDVDPTFPYPGVGTSMPSNDEVDIEIDGDLTDRDVEVVKDMIHVCFEDYFDSEHTSDVDVEINNAL